MIDFGLGLNADLQEETTKHTKGCNDGKVAGQMHQHQLICFVHKYNLQCSVWPQKIQYIAVYSPKS